MNDGTAMFGCTGEVCAKTGERTRAQFLASSIHSDSNKHLHRAPGAKLMLVTLAAVLLILAILHVSSTKTKPYYLNVSHSVPLGIYRVIPSQNIGIGDMVVFDPPEKARSYVYDRRWLPNNWSLIKYVGATEGDTYAIVDGTFTINNKYVGLVSERDSNGKALPYNGGRFKVDPDTFLPVSTHISNSFDGRYFGTVPLSAIRAKLKPLWTF